MWMMVCKWNQRITMVILLKPGCFSWCSFRGSHIICSCHHSSNLSFTQTTRYLWWGPYKKTYNIHRKRNSFVIMSVWNLTAGQTTLLTCLRRKPKHPVLDVLYGKHFQPQTGEFYKVCSVLNVSGVSFYRIWNNLLLY